MLQGMNCLQRVGKAMNRPGFSDFGGRGNSFTFFCGEGYDYARKAGPVWKSTIPLTCLIEAGC